MPSSFDAIYMQLAQALASRSHCIKRQVGAVLTKETRVVATGYNGPPKGTHHCDEKWPQQGCPRSLRGGCSLAIHAEQNAILYALQNKVDLQGATLYVTLTPCLPCARIILSAGIRHVVYQESYADYKKIEKEEGLDFLAQFGITLKQYQGTPAH